LFSVVLAGKSIRYPACMGAANLLQRAAARRANRLILFNATLPVTHASRQPCARAVVGVTIAGNFAPPMLHLQTKRHGR
jgi:hypothetical protein